jgi:hypothetical protein
MGMKQGVVLALAALALAACGDSTTKTAQYTKYQQLSQVDWADMTAASTAAHVGNDRLIMMR